MVMVNEIIISKILMAVWRVILKMAIVAAAVLVIDVIGLVIYGSLVGKNMFSSLWFLLVLEGAVMMFFGLMGTTVVPQARTIGVPWSGSIRAAVEEIRRDRVKQVEFWVAVGIVGIILCFLGLLAHG